MHDLASRDNPENRKNLYEALLASMLLIPVPEIPSGVMPGIQTLQAKTPFQLITGLNGRNQKVTPAFTDLEALRTWNSNIPYIGLNAGDHFRIVLGTEIQEVIINPFDPAKKMIRPTGTVTRREVEFLAQGTIPSRMSQNIDQHDLSANDIRAIGVPAQRLSVDVEDALRSKAFDLGDVDQLYAFQMATQAASSTVVGIELQVDLPPGERNAIVRSLGDSVQPMLGAGWLDFLILRGALGDQIRSVGLLIFSRRRRS